MSAEPVEETTSSGKISRMYSQPRIDKGAHQPSPDRPLMVCRITRAEVTVVGGLIVPFAGGEGAQSDRR